MGLYSGVWKHTRTHYSFSPTLRLFTLTKCLRWESENGRPAITSGIGNPRIDQTEWNATDLFFCRTLRSTAHAWRWSEQCFRPTLIWRRSNSQLVWKVFVWRCSVVDFFFIWFVRARDSRVFRSSATVAYKWIIKYEHLKMAWDNTLEPHCDEKHGSGFFISETPLGAEHWDREIRPLYNGNRYNGVGYTELRKNERKLCPKSAGA